MILESNLRAANYKIYLMTLKIIRFEKKVLKKITRSMLEKTGKG